MVFQLKAILYARDQMPEHEKKIFKLILILVFLFLSNLGFSQK